MSEDKREFWLIILAFFIIYFVWGSTYLANTWGVKEIPPFMFAGTRFLVAGILLLGIARFFDPIQISWQQFKNTTFSGLLLFAGGNGLVVWALQYVDSGISALIVAFEPLIVAFMLWIWKSDPPNKETWIGIGLGIFGMTLLVGQPEFVGNQEWVIGVVMIVIALIAWGYIAIWIPTADLPASIMQSSASQMIMGGISLFIISAFFQESQNFQLEQITPKALWSFIYLVVFGSILAFSSFNFLLKKVSPTKVVTSAYVNPVVAVFLGWWLNNEKISGQSLTAAAILLTGVVFITRAKSSSK